MNMDYLTFALHVGVLALGVLRAAVKGAQYLPQSNLP